MSAAASTSTGLPVWAVVTPHRREHIERVTALLAQWAGAMAVPPEEAAAWRDAGLWHDALRDAPSDALRALVGDSTRPAEMLHGPAAALRLERDGERRADVLQAVRWHTVGCASWSRTGRALYLADYLEPGRSYARRQRALLAARVPRDFDGVLRSVVRARIGWALREGNPLFAETVELWNQVR